VVAGLSGTVSLVAVPANLLAIPAIAPATVLGVAAAVLSPVWPTGAEFAAWLGHWPAWWLVLVARFGAQAPGGTLPWFAGAAGGICLAALTVLLLLVARHPTARRWLAGIAAALLVGTVAVRVVAPGWPPRGWVLAVCAVGQGDAIVLPVGVGQAVIVDAGPDPPAVDRCLRRLGVRVVPLLLISHLHADHAGGLDGVLRDRRVAAVRLPQWAEPEAARTALLRQAGAAGVPVGEINAGWRYSAGPLRMVLLGPAQPMRGTRSDVNNNSLVIRAEVRGIGILLVGDAETEQQQELLASYPPEVLRAEVLKVAHHGSEYQEPRFLDVVAPRVALVAVGLGNTYGHPAGSVLARLRAGGARVLRTDTDGDLAVVVDGQGELRVAVRGPDRDVGR
jgi:competence protein ComEC